MLATIKLSNKQTVQQTHVQLTPRPTANSPVVIFMWFDGHYYKGSLGMQSYSFATPNDIVVGYNYENTNKDWFVWLLQINNLSPTQFYWIQEGTFPVHQWNDTGFHQQLSLIISNKLKTNRCNTVVLNPYWDLDGMRVLINKIRSYLPPTINNAVITGIESELWIDKFGSKACLHRYIDKLDTPSLVESVNMFNTSILVGARGLTELQGYICKSKTEILIAFDTLTEEIGHNNVVLKRPDGWSGDDISFWNNKHDIINKFVWEDSFELITVEQDLRYSVDKRFEIKKVDFVGISFYDNEIIGGAHEQIIRNEAEFVGSKSYSNKIIEDRLKQITRFDVMDKIDTKFKGGFDYAIQYFFNENIPPKIYLMDVNTGRPTATLQTFIIMKKFNIKNKFFIRRNIKIKANASFTTFNEMDTDILFNENTKKGIYFHTFYPQGKIAVISIFEGNEIKANELYETLQKLEFVVPDKNTFV